LDGGVIAASFHDPHRIGAQGTDLHDLRRDLTRLKVEDHLFRRDYELLASLSDNQYGNADFAILGIISPNAYTGIMLTLRYLGLGLQSELKLSRMWFLDCDRHKR
jgi:hypothetical protein